MKINMPDLNFLLGNYCPEKARSFHLDFPVNLIIKIISSDAKDNTQYRRNLGFFSPTLVHSTGFILKIFIETI